MTPILDDGQLDRATGVLLGAAAGDALGAGYEFTHPTPSQRIAMIGGGIGGFDAGEWTDDTAMTVAIAEVTAAGLDLRSTPGLDAVAAGFLRWFASGPKDVGIQTSKILSGHPTSGAAMTEASAALPGLTGGNGSLMRTAPVALAYLDAPTARAEAALAVSRLTHADHRAGQACQIWCRLIADAVLTAEIDRSWSFLTDISADAEEFWGPLKEAAETGGPADFPDNGWVVHALQTAWWAITRAGDGPAALPRGLELAIRAGHDTDTTACIAGALLGARWGAAAVPVEWQAMLHGWPGLTAEDLERLALQTVRSAP